MQNIITASGLSAGAVYNYFKSKDALIIEAVTASLAELTATLRSLLQTAPPPSPADLAATTAATITVFAHRGDIDFVRIALLGWAEAQRNPRLLAAIREHYAAFRSEIAAIADIWRATGHVRDGADCDAVAKTLLSVILGFIVQSAILGEIAPEAIGAGLRALTPD